jgi:anti-sigma regulatory factor (Ser/Thr protein kinase)
MEAITGATDDLEWIAVDEPSAAAHARGVAMAVARRIKFSDRRVGEVAIAVTELATNLYKHAVGGMLLVRLRRHLDAAAVEVTAVDTGPGWAAGAASLVDGTSTTGTLGIGLGAVVRLATWFDAYSLVGRGTVVTATFWEGAAPLARPTFAALTRTVAGETVCGDACAVRDDGASTTFVLVDGLGHGEFAALAAREATRAFLAAAPAEPAVLIEILDRALRATRGAAIAVLRIDRGERRILFCGVGNVAVWVDDGERRHGFLSTPGIVGHNVRKTRSIASTFAKGALVVMHSDGLSAKWRLDDYPNARGRDPQIVAALLLRDAGVRHDDASVLVATLP